MAARKSFATTVILDGKQHVYKPNFSYEHRLGIRAKPCAYCAQELKGSGIMVEVRGKSSGGKVTWTNHYYHVSCFAKESGLPLADLSVARGATRPDQRESFSRRKSSGEYGDPIDFRGLRHAPINEQGVVYLFGMISRELGFLVEAVRTHFPDCEAKRATPGRQGRWESARIEFEYKSSTSKRHGHNLDDCDLIVCWEHDWPDWPFEVLELKSAIQRLKADG